MSNYYQTKYPSLRPCHYIKPILPVNTLFHPLQVNVENLRDKLGICPNDVVFLYSGGLQKWQNFDMMLRYIVLIAQPNFKFIILTKQVEEAIGRISKMASSVNFHVESVVPENLPIYYEIAHYGFLLRDDITLNRIAAPTKLIEYLFFGLKPIMKNLHVGDFLSYGCDYVQMDTPHSFFVATKSEKNKQIAKRIQIESLQRGIRNQLFRDNLKRNS